jgi:hypothetical protein
MNSKSRFYPVNPVQKWPTHKKNVFASCGRQRTLSLIGHGNVSVKVENAVEVNGNGFVSGNKYIKMAGEKSSCCRCLGVSAMSR